MSDEIIFEKEMGIDHADFLRLLPRALDGLAFTVNGNRIVIEDGARRLEIILGETSERRIALLTLPVTPVRFEFTGYHADEADAAMRRIDQAYQRGGG